MLSADTLRSGLRAAGNMLFWGAVTGALVYGISHLSFDQPFSGLALLYSALIGTVYVIGMSSFMRASKRLVSRLVPLRSRRAVWVHTTMQSLSMLISFVAITALLELVLGGYFSVGLRFLWIVALVAFSAAFIGHSFSYMHRFHQRMREAEATAYEAQLQALRAQVNPHFLFNAFNSIAALIRTRPAEAETVVEDLADLFRYTLQASKQESASLGEELHAARLYLDIERVRFRDRLRVQIDVPEALHAVRVPGMTLQPLAENAVKHGVSQTDARCTVTAEARRQDDTLRLRVTDTGPGFDSTDPDEVLERGTGLANVYERLRLFCGPDATFTIRPQGIELTLPLQTADDGSPSSFAQTDGHPSLRDRTDVPK